MRFRDRVRAAWAVFKDSRYAPWEFLGGGFGQTASLDQSYLKVYLASPSVYAAVNRIAEDAASVPLVIERGGREVSPEDQAARVFAAANPLESDVSLWRRFWISMELVGQSYLLTDYMGRATPQELWVMQALAMRIKTTPTGMPERYFYAPEGGSEIPYEPREIYHCRYPHPERDLEGASPVQAAQYAIALELATLKHWTKFFKQGARPSLLLFRENPVDEAGLKRALENAKQQLAGEDNAWRIGAIPGGWQPKEIGTNPREADFAESSKLLREYILACFGVPPAVAGVLRSGGLSDANVSEQKTMYWQNTIIPKLTLLERDLEELVLPRFGAGYTCRFDYEAVAGVQDIMLDRATRYGSLIANGMLSVNAAREQTGQPRVTGGDQVYLPISLQSVGFEVPEEPLRGAPPPQRAKGLEGQERQALRVKTEKHMDALEQLTVADWRKFQEDQKNRLLNRLAEAQKTANLRKSYELVEKDIKLEDLWDDEYEAGLLKALILRVLARIITTRGQQLLDQVVPDTEFLLSSPTVAQFMNAYTASQVQHVMNTTREAVRQILKLAADSGASIGQMQQMISGMSEFSLVRALTVARTEVTAGYNFASLEAFEQSGVVKKKEWLTVGDDVVRDSHMACEAQGAIPNDERFQNGLLYPGDGAGDAAEVINCRCALVPVVERARSVRLAPSLLEALAGNGNGKEPSQEGHLQVSGQRMR